MDPLGFALENFNTVGQYREFDAATHTPIDTSGVMADGTAVNGPDGLRQALMARSELFVQTFTGQLMAYAWAARSTTTTCPWYAALCAKRRATTTGFHPSFCKS